MSQAIPTPQNGSSRRATLAAGAAVVLLVLATYWPSLTSRYVLLDDTQYVVDNPLVRNPSWEGVRRFFTEVRQPSTVAGYYQPLTMLSLMADTLLAGESDVPPFYGHLQNILWHAAASVLLLLVCRRCAGSLPAAFGAAAIFAMHPAQVESVAWISQRKAVLAAALAMGSMLAYLRWGAARRRGWLAASVVLYLLATLAKPTVVPLALVFPLLDVWPLRRAWRSSLLEKWGFVAVMAVMGAVALVSQSSSEAKLAVPNFSSATLVMKWISLLAYNLMLYAGNVLWPMHLSPFRAIPSELTPANPVILLSLVGSAGLAGVWLWSLRRAQPLFVGLTAAGLLLAPALGPLQFFASCVADRFLNLPLCFLMLPLAAGLARLERRGGRSRMSERAAVAALCVVLLWLNRRQQLVWQDSKSLWSHVAARAPDYATAHGHLAVIALQEGQHAVAVAEAERAYQLQPLDADAAHLLGRAYARAGRAKAGAMKIREALQRGLGRNEAAGQVSLAEALVIQGDLAGARAELDKAIALGRHAAESYAMLGDAARQFGSRNDLAEACYQEALRRDPQNRKLAEAVREIIDRMHRPTTRKQAP